MQHWSSIKCVKFAFNEYSICISNDFNVFSCGYSVYRAHGHEKEQTSIPTQINNLTNIKMIDCGLNHSICIDFNGNVFSFGCNDKGQLGIVTCGFEFAMCLTEDNNVYSFGFNKRGQLGLGNNNKCYASPQLIPDLNNIEFILSSGYYSICKTYDNEFYSWGNNGYGQLGQGNNNKSCNTPVQCNNWPDNIISIKCGSHHTLLLTSEGQVYSFGGNDCGQLGINDENIRKINIPTLIKDIPEIQRIECGSNHSMCIDINDNLWLFGYNSYGQLGLGDIEDRYKPIIHPKLSNIIDISSGGDHTFVKTLDYKIYAFGYNRYSQLGIKTPEDNQLIPIQVFKDIEDIWCSFTGKSKQKSARK